MTTSMVTVPAVAGKDGFAYLNTAAQGAGFHGTPTWVLIDNIQDLDCDPQEMEKFKASIRRSGGVNVYMMTMNEIGVKFKCLWIPTDPLCVAMLAAYQARKALDMIFLDGPQATTGSQGPRADWLVAKMPRPEHLTDGMTIDIELCPGITANPPGWYRAA
jgi:hypothetical protein